MLQSIFLFLNLGGSEIFTIVLVFLMLFGAKNIPEIARGLGRGMRQFKDATNDVQREIQDSASKVKDQVDITKETK